MGTATAIARLDPAAVVAAYRNHPELDPVRGAYGHFDRENLALIRRHCSPPDSPPPLCSCCALLALVYDRRPEVKAARWGEVDLDDLAGWLGVDPEYAAGFVRAWDDWDHPGPGRIAGLLARGLAGGDANIVGEADGMAAVAAMIAAGLVAEDISTDEDEEDDLFEEEDDDLTDEDDLDFDDPEGWDDPLGEDEDD